MDQRPPQRVREALVAVIKYLWNDEYADYLETSPREGRDDHILVALRTVKRWLKETADDPSVTATKRRQSDGL
jgi:hypothetical protein